MIYKLFNINQACFVGKIKSILPGFKNLSEENQFKTILCLTKPAAAKVANQYLPIIFLAGANLLDGSNIDMLSYPTLPVNQCQCNFDLLSDVEDEWENLDSVLDESIT
jgi:hypothetical protein